MFEWAIEYPARLREQNPPSNSTSHTTLELDAYSHINALAGLLAQDTAAADFNRDLDRLLTEIAHLGEP